MQAACMLMVCLGLVLGMSLEAYAGKPSTVPLPAPAALAASAAQGRIDLSWAYSDTSGISGFAVERSNSATSGFAQVAATDSATFSYSDQGLASGKTYYYRTRSYKQKGKNVDYSTYSATVSATTASSQPIPVPQPGAFEFDISTYRVGENAGRVDITIMRVGGSDGVATVDWRTMGVTATYGADYGDFNWTTLTFAAGETVKVQSIAIVDDTAVEGDETFNVLLGNPTGGATLGSVTTAAVTIQDNDSAPVPVPGSFEFAVSGYSVNEGAGSVNITIKRVGGSDGVATVDWKTQGVTATFAADYGDFDWTTLTFAAGETSKTQSIAIVDDTAVEGNETFNVLLGNPTGGATLGSITTAAVTIQDNDTAATPVPGSFEFAVSGYSVNEAAGSVSITIKRVGGSDGVATVDWKTQGVTATFAADYGDFDWTTLTFAAGETSKTQSVAIYDDTLVEGNETFKVLLGNPTGGATLGSITTAAVTIVDDDQDSTTPPPPPAVGYLPVFPGAQGFGTETKAGRGGQIIKVTNLNDSGSGSLRAAIDASGARIVVFEVSGTILLSSDMFIRNPFITIAGQTAPSPGVSLRGAALRVATHDVLVQHIRTRVGDSLTGPAPGNRDGFAIEHSSNPPYNVVFDHCSAAWSVDGAMDLWFPMQDVTISNSVFMEALNNSIHPQGAHSLVFLVGDHAKRVSVVGCLFAHNTGRTPGIKGNTSLVLLNNLMYNAGSWSFGYMNDDNSTGPMDVSLVGNVYIKGADSTSSTKGLIAQSNVKSGTRVYLSDNVFPGTLFTNQTGSNLEVSSSPLWHPSLVARASSTVESLVLANVGARPADRDAVDERVVNEVKSRSGNIIDSPQQVGGWPNLAKNTRAFNVPSNPNGDDDGDGYTNIEEILHQMAAQVEGR